jgi:alkylated DNA nucleotide flippase Atl1
MRPRQANSRYRDTNRSEGNVVKAKETNLEGVLEGKKQYQVPLYQRRYTWGKDQIDQLWTDLVDLVETRKTDPTATHFIGSLVLAASPDSFAFGLHKFLVVDGQQRLTTLTILLAALRDHQVAAGDEGHRDRIDSQYLINKYEQGQPHKVVPTQEDRPAYASIIESAATAGGSDTIGKAYRLFLGKIAEADDPEDPHDIEAIENAVLRGLAVVAVTAEPGDNAHRIFESLNNTGLKLTQGDLIRNYIFMRLGDRAEAVYHSIWLPMEKLVKPENLEFLFWLDLVADDEKVTQADTYVGQQKRLERLTPDAIERDVHRLAGLGSLLAIVLEPHRDPHPAIRRRIERLSAWGSTTAIPLVMQLLVKRAAVEATDEQVASALLVLESYFVRRIIIGRATANLNRTLLAAAAVVSRSDNVDVALRSYLSMGRRHFGTDGQVREAVRAVPFYWQGRASQKKLILEWIEESYGSKEPVDPARMTIEHVLPQTLSDEVRAEFSLGVPEGSDVAYEHERIVHTLGNLTLSGYNSELSNKPFTAKKKMLADSGLRMNQEIARHDQWGLAEIQHRADQLAGRIIELWPGPDETVREHDETESDLRRTVTSIVAVIPAGRWTSYGEVALVAGNYPQPVAAVVSRYVMANAWRVLQAAGTISPGFRWTEPGRTDDPRAVLEAEGLAFNQDGRALPELFVPAQELAAASGLDVDTHDMDLRREAFAANSPSVLGTQQLVFWERVREWGLLHAEHVREWYPPIGKNWYCPLRLVPGVGIEMTANSLDNRVSAELYIYDNKALFTSLLAHRDVIEADLGFALEWREMPEAKASRIVVFHDGDFRDDSLAPELVEWLVTTADSITPGFARYL